MRILLTNDDGIQAPGLAGLYQAVRDLGDVHVVAPEVVQSGVGHAISVETPLATQRVKTDIFEGWAVDGRPADCVKLALYELLDELPDFVISGVNAGLNTSLYLFYSGTVAAAAEAACFFGVPSMAVSLDSSDSLDFEKAGRIAARVFEQWSSTKPAAGSLINVNIPSLDQGLPKGIRFCRHSVTPGDAHYESTKDSENRSVYTLIPDGPEQTSNTGSDTEAVQDGYVSVTPLRFDVTDYKMLAETSDWNWTLDL